VRRAEDTDMRKGLEINMEKWREEYKGTSGIKEWKKKGEELRYERNNSPLNFSGILRLFKILIGKNEGKRPLGRTRCRWEDNIKTDLREIGLEDMDWIHLVEDRDRWKALVNTVMNLHVS
jgi:hypothetical protein